MILYETFVDVCILILICVGNLWHEPTRVFDCICIITNLLGTALVGGLASKHNVLKGDRIRIQFRVVLLQIIVDN